MGYFASLLAPRSSPSLRLLLPTVGVPCPPSPSATSATVGVLLDLVLSGMRVTHGWMRPFALTTLVGATSPEAAWVAGASDGKSLLPLIGSSGGGRRTRQPGAPVDQPARRSRWLVGLAPPH